MSTRIDGLGLVKNALSWVIGKWLGQVWTSDSALKFCFKTCVAMKFVDDDDDEGKCMKSKRASEDWQSRLQAVQWGLYVMKSVEWNLRSERAMSGRFSPLPAPRSASAPSFSHTSPTPRSTLLHPIIGPLRSVFCSAHMLWFADGQRVTDEDFSPFLANV